MKLKMVAITACPTGIAHTQMAANALKSKAEALGIEIAVEQQGAEGPSDILTKEQIAQADYVLFAVGKEVIGRERFDGKRVVEVGVGHAVTKAETLLQEFIDGKYTNAHILQANSQQDDDIFQLSTRKGVYKHLMTGVSFMMPFIVAGGIFIGLSFAFGIHSATIGDPTYNPISWFLMTLGGSGAFKLVVPILAGFIAQSIAGPNALMAGMVGGFLADTNKAGFLGGIIAGFIAGYATLFVKRLLKFKLPPAVESLKPILFFPLLGLLCTGLVLLPLLSPIAGLMEGITNFLNSLDKENKSLIGMLIGGMMATDMGGPINKTASLFADAAFASGNASFESSKMAGGMVPPLAIAMCTSIFPKLFSSVEKKAGMSCYFLGSCFITEGVLPFAASDPIRVILASIIGSCLAGYLCQFTNITLMATHGGIFVIPIANKPILYIAIILGSSLVSALLLGFLKMKKKEAI